MTEYVYGFRLEHEDGEVFFCLPAFPEVISAVPEDQFSAMDDRGVTRHAHDAVITALQAVIRERAPLPPVDDLRHLRVDGAVRLSPLEAMKLELYRVYVANCRSVSEFADELRKSETAARRLLDLRHQSWTREVEAAIARFGKKLIHRWELQAA
jgi:hypothetical protein